MDAKQNVTRTSFEKGYIESACKTVKVSVSLKVRNEGTEIVQLNAKSQPRYQAGKTVQHKTPQKITILTKSKLTSSFPKKVAMQLVSTKYKIDEYKKHVDRIKENVKTNQNRTDFERILNGQ